MARIFRTLLVAAVNAIKEFLAFATKNCLQDTLIFDIIGNITILGKKFTDFSQNNYIKVPLYSYENSLEFVIHYITSPNSVSFAALIMPGNTTDGLMLRQNGGTTFYAWAGNSSHWNALNSFNTGVPIDVNQERWIKINVNGTSISFSYSTDGETWTTANTGTLSAKINFTNGIGLGAGITDSYNTYNWSNGIILLEDCYFQYDDTKLVPYLYPKQLDDTIKLNDGIASSNYDWSACQDNEYGQFTATGTIEQIKEINDEVVYVTAEPEQDNKEVQIKTGKVYYAYTNENDSDDSVYTIDNPIKGGDLIELPTLSENGVVGGDNYACEASNTYSSNFAAYKTFMKSTIGDVCWYSGRVSPCSLTYYTPTAIKLKSVFIMNEIQSPSSFKSCIIQGSNDNTIWNDLYTINNWPSTGSYSETININSNTEYKYFRFYFTSDYGDGVAVQQIILYKKENPSILYDNTFTALNPQPTFTVHTEGIQNLINKGCTDLGNGIYQGSAGNIIQTDFVPDFANANTWEIATKYTYNTGNSYATILGYGYYSGTSFRDYSAPYIGTENSSTFRVFLALGSQSWAINNFNTGVDKTGTTWIKLKFTGTQYIFSYKKQENDPYTDVLVTTSSTKAYCTSPIGFLNLPYSTTTYASLGTIDFKETSITIDGQTTTFYDTESGVAIGNDLYERNINKDDIKDIIANISTIDNTTMQSVTINCPTVGQKDIYYYGYTNTSDESIYITDSEPITSTTFNLQNAKIIGTINNDNGVFSNFSRGNYIQLINKRPVHSFDFIIKCKPGTGTSFGRLIQTQPDTQGIMLNCTTSSVNCYVSRRTAYGWDVLNGFVTGITMSADTEIYVRITWSDTDGIYRFYQSSNGIDWEAKNYSDSGKLSPYWVNNSQTIGANTDSYNPWNGSVDMNETKLTIDGVTLTYKKQQSISILYENTGTTEFTPEVIEPQPTFTVQDEGLINCTNDNCTISSDGWATGGSNKKLVSTFIPNFGAANTWEFQCTFEYNGGGSSSYGQSILGLATGGGAQIPSLCAFSNGFRMCLSSNGSNWNICDVSKKEYTLTAGQIYNIKFGFTGTEYYLDVKRDEETDFPAQHYWSLSSTTKVYNNTTVYMELMNYAGLESSMYFNGPIDLNKTYIIVDGVRTNFYTKSSIKIQNNIYERNSAIDSSQTISTDPAVIETNAIITQPNNDIFISDGRYVILNLTAPSSMTTYIQSSGINYQLLDMPLLLKRNSGVGLLIKDNNTILYRRSWTLERDLDLHYQLLNFQLNVENANILVKVNNREIPYPYIVYSGDNYTYTISKDDYVDYNGSGTAGYSSKDGNEITIEANLTPSVGTVDTTDYTYTIDNEGNMILTGYVGTNTDTTTPNITENL